MTRNKADRLFVGFHLDKQPPRRLFDGAAAAREAGAAEEEEEEEEAWQWGHTVWATIARTS